MMEVPGAHRQPSHFGPNMRAASAEARGVLLDLASVQLGVPVSQLDVKDGIVRDTKNPKNSVTYATACKRKEAGEIS